MIIIAFEGSASLLVARLDATTGHSLSRIKHGYERNIRLHKIASFVHDDCYRIRVTAKPMMSIHSLWL